MDAFNSALLIDLKEKNQKYYGKLLELRDIMSDWLSYIPNSFPHYTRHTLRHSEEIISQLSSLLFSDTGQAVANLSAMEIYILAASAYLHDAGMVVSDREKAQIINSEDWQDWVGDGGSAHERLKSIESLRKTTNTTNETVRNFLADLQLRFLIAEFVRARHHHRSGDLIRQSSALLANFTFGNPTIEETVADICIAHGLPRNMLEDPERYPERRDIDGYPVNVRFLALLLRIGDLLDMSHDRACPLLLNAASPVPADSLAHWRQYKCLTHRVTSPERVEIRAKCSDQSEHRVLLDWCQWIVEEVSNAAILMQRAKRHGNWKAPVTTLAGESPSIEISPSPNARYFFSDWRLTVDQTEILNRLIYSVHEDKFAFVKELIQNSLDATRCKMYLDLALQGRECPDLPTHIDSEIRKQYPVKIRLEEVAVENELSQSKEVRQVLSIEDCGVGMDRNVIERYFLQIGRSYYVSREFRKNFNFSPTSRFGVGFLSVFSVSDEATVETFNPLSPSGSGAIRMTLTGPRNYLLTEKADRPESGTKISIVLRSEVNVEELIEMIRRFCRMVEFPVLLTADDKNWNIEAEPADGFATEVPVLDAEDSKFVIRPYPISRSGLEGSIYVFAHVTKDGESWGDIGWAKYVYARKSPLAEVPELPSDLICLNGLTISDYSHHSRAYSTRVDYRGKNANVSMARRELRAAAYSNTLTEEVERILSDHLQSSPFAQGAQRWKYVQKLIKHFPVGSFWNSVERGAMVREGRETRTASIKQLATIDEFITRIPIISSGSTEEYRACPAGHWLSQSDLENYSDQHRKLLFTGRVIEGVTVSGKNCIDVRWLRMANLAGKNVIIGDGRPMFITDLPFENTIGIAIHKTTDSVYEQCVLNRSHPFTEWLLRVETAANNRKFNLEPKQFSLLMDALDYPLRGSGYRFKELSEFLTGWRSIPGLTEDLFPPQIEINQFRLYKHGLGSRFEVAPLSRTPS